MPINIPRTLPAFQTLSGENVFVMCEELAQKQDIRPLEVAIVNLMPTKIETETQLLRLLSNTPIQVNVTLIKTATHISKNTALEHMETFYTTFNKIKNRKFDALVITGAPVEKLPFEEVTYWEELCSIMEWSKTNVFSTMYICWGAQAGLYYHYRINKQNLETKLSGIYSQVVVKKHQNHPLLKGFSDYFYVPQSRYTEIISEDVDKNENLDVLATSRTSGRWKTKKSGDHIIADKTGRQFFITGHAEYDTDTLAKEYERDKDKNLEPNIPHNYFDKNTPKNAITNTWRGHASLMYSNWLNFCVYQKTPFDINRIEPLVI
ncbi:MAG: homoserine O-succinyltransferase [Oscillospiraceae bacterium]|nr:homoserine O-succinyltransferase [Oscillospiraceae bacterium]